MNVIETHRLILREFLGADSTALINIFADEKVMHYGETVRGEPWIQAWIQDMQTSYRARGYGNWAIVTKKTMTCIGYCGLSFAPSLDGQSEVALGYRLAQAHWNLGYATEAVKATLNYGLRKLSLPSIVAMIDPANLASICVAEKVGMVHEKDVMLDWYTHPDHLYRIDLAGF